MISGVAKAAGETVTVSDDSAAYLVQIGAGSYVAVPERENWYPWEDLRFPVTAINPPGAVADPSLDATTGTFLFSASATNTIAIVAQMPHAWHPSGIRPHVHWSKSTSADGDVVWQLQYRMANNGSTMPGEYTTVTAKTPLTTDNDTAGEMMITSFSDVRMDGMKPSCLIHFLLSRLGGDNADTYGGTARLWEFDVHYRVGSRGSITEVPS
jgi:hypothetical protein